MDELFFRKSLGLYTQTNSGTYMDWRARVGESCILGSLCRDMKVELWAMQYGCVEGHVLEPRGIVFFFVGDNR